MKWLRTIAAFCLLWLCGFTPAQQVVLFGNVPSWISHGSLVDIDFTNYRTWNCSGFSCLTIVRASMATNLVPSSAAGFSYVTYQPNTLRIDRNGLLIEEGRTNVFLNSTAPATQTINFATTGNRTLWVNGTGSIVMSAGTATGCGTGTATNGTVVTFNITVAGTCVFTKSGSLNAAQVEAGTFGTSLIVTGGASAARSGDVITAAGMFLSTLKNDQASVVYAQSGSPNAAGIPVMLDKDIVTNNPIYFTDGTHVSAFAGANLIAQLGSGNLTGATKIALGYSTAGRSIVANNGTVATSSITFSGSWTSPTVGSSNNASFYDGYITRISLWNMRLSDATLQSLTQ